MGVGRGFRELFTEEECKQCILLREWLEVERNKRDYLERLLFTKAGILRDNDEVYSPDSYESIHRISTMSSIRRLAGIEIAKKHEREAKQVIPEAIVKFEEALQKES